MAGYSSDPTYEFAERQAAAAWFDELYPFLQRAVLLRAAASFNQDFNIEDAVCVVRRHAIDHGGRLIPQAEDDLKDYAAGFYMEVNAALGYNRAFKETVIALAERRAQADAAGAEERTEGTARRYAKYYLLPWEPYVEGIFRAIEHDPIDRSVVSGHSAAALDALCVGMGIGSFSGWNDRRRAEEVSRGAEIASGSSGGVGRSGVYNYTEYDFDPTGLPVPRSASVAGTGDMVAAITAALDEAGVSDPGGEGSDGPGTAGGRGNPRNTRGGTGGGASSGGRRGRSSRR